MLGAPLVVVVAIAGNGTYPDDISGCVLIKMKFNKKKTGAKVFSDHKFAVKLLPPVSTRPRGRDFRYLYCICHIGIATQSGSIARHWRCGNGFFRAGVFVVGNDNEECIALPASVEWNLCPHQTNRIDVGDVFDLPVFVA